jgi:hypothetical protein
MATELSELVRERCAAKIADGKAPSKADLAWLDATSERPPAESHVELSRNAKGETQIAVKVYDRDPAKAEEIATATFTRLRGMYPMSDGTVGAPMRSAA